MPNSTDALRRWLGTFCLAMAAGLLIWGQTILKPHLGGVVFLLYWLACFAFTLAAIGIALLDVRAVRRRLRDEQRELVERALDDVQVEEKTTAQANTQTPKPQNNDAASDP